MLSKQVNYQAAIDLINVALSRVPMLERLRTDFSRISARFTAQQEMADRLHSAFAERQDVAVLSYLELEVQQRKFALDHLVLGVSSAVLIDSRSGTGSLYVDCDGQWSQEEGDRKRPMGFPLKQMEDFQAEVSSILSGILQQVLPASKDEARRECVAAYRTDGYIAVSPDAQLHNWPYKNLGVMVRTQDQVVRTIERRSAAPERQFLARLGRLWRKEQSPPRALTPSELAKAADLVLARDCAPTPLRMVTNAVMERDRSIPPGVQAAVRRIREQEENDSNLAATTNDTLCMLHFCPHCGAEQLEIEGSGGNWHFVCSACARASPVEAVCFECGADGTISRIKKTFFIRCRACGAERVFFFNH